MNDLNINVKLDGVSTLKICGLVKLFTGSAISRFFQQDILYRL